MKFSSKRVFSSGKTESYLQHKTQHYYCYRMIHPTIQRKIAMLTEDVAKYSKAMFTITWTNEKQMLVFSSLHNIQEKTQDHPDTFIKAFQEKYKKFKLLL